MHKTKTLHILFKESQIPVWLKPPPSPHQVEVV